MEMINQLLLDNNNYVTMHSHLIHFNALIDLDKIDKWAVSVGN